MGSALGGINEGFSGVSDSFRGCIQGLMDIQTWITQGFADFNEGLSFFGGMFG